MATTISGGAPGVNTAAATLGPAGITFGDATVQTTAAGIAPVVTINTSPGTWTKPSTVKAIKVTVVAGGGSGAIGKGGPAATPAPNFAGGGGSGGGAIGYFPAPSLPGPQPYTVGAGGTTAVNIVNASMTTGGSGTASSFGALVTTTGGSGGGIDGKTGGSAGGGTSAPNVVVYYGSPGFYNYGGVALGTGTYGGNGGNTLFGAAGIGTLNSPIGGTGSGYGGGGGAAQGASTIPYQGGTGSAGVIIIEEFY